MESAAWCSHRFRAEKKLGKYLKRLNYRFFILKMFSRNSFLDIEQGQLCKAGSGHIESQNY